MKLDPAELTVIIDTREQRPYDLTPFPSKRFCLPTGDYSVEGYETILTLERKNRDDFIGSICQGRERFEKEVERLKPFVSKVILVECSAQDIAEHRYLSRMHPNSVMGTIAKYIAAGVNVFLASNREIAQDFARRFLYQAVRQQKLLQPVADSDTKQLPVS